MGGTLIKAAIGGFLIWLASQAGAVTQQVLERVRLSVQASELQTLDGHLAVWAIEHRRTRPPRDQAEFEEAVRGLFTSRGEREVTRDRWGHTYRYRRLAVRPVRWQIASDGPDGRPGSPDDLVVERDGDAVSMNADPVAIAEGALELQQAQQEETLRRLRALAAKLEHGEPPAHAPLFPDVPERAAPRGASAEALRRALEALDPLLARD